MYYLSPFVCVPLKKSDFMNRPESGTPLGFTGFFKMFPPAHFLFKTASFDQFAKPPNRFLNGLFVPND